MQIAAGSIRAGMDTVVVAGGTHSSSSMPQVWHVLEPGGEPQMWMSPSHPETPDAPAFDMSITVGENTAAEVGITRHDVDEWAAYSHRQAIASIDSGAFEEEIVPVEYVDREGAARTFSVDEHPRRGVTVEIAGRAQADPPRARLAHGDRGQRVGHQRRRGRAGAHERRLRRGARAATAGAASCRGRTPASSPRAPAWAPRGAIPKALDRAGLTLDDIDLIEINEAFCSVPVAAIRTLGIDPSIVNVNGSGCSLGHPIAATGARMVTTMVHELRRRGKTHGLLAMCAGGGMGSALVIEVA